MKGRLVAGSLVACFNWPANTGDGDNRQLDIPSLTHVGLLASSIPSIYGLPEHQLPMSTFLERRNTETLRRTELALHLFVLL